MLFILQVNYLNYYMFLNTFLYCQTFNIFKNANYSA